LDGAAMQGLTTMSSQELDRLQVIQRVIEGRMTQRAAATSLGIGYRTMKRLVANYRQRGAAGLVSGKRGRPSNHRLPSSYIDQIIAIVREHYADFGPTLAAEKLQDRLYLARSGHFHLALISATAD
jgi:transposase